jgi:hypothetical protein
MRELPLGIGPVTEDPHWEMGTSVRMLSPTTVDPLEQFQKNM